MEPQKPLRLRTLDLRRLSLRATLNLRLAALEAKLAAKLEAKLKVISSAHEIRILDFLKKQI